MDLDVAAELLRSAFERVKSTGTPCREFCCALTDRIARFRIVGRRLAHSISAPFSHLELHDADEKRADLTVDLWDVEESAIACPLGPGSRDVGESGVVTSSPDGSLVAHEREHSGVLIDRRAQHVVGWVVSERRRHSVERARPLNLPLAVWCGDRDVQLVHAALVARRGSGVLLAGVGGAGKSTAALTCAGAGYDFLGDDCVGLRLAADDTFEGYSFYNSVTFTPEHLVRVGVRGVVADGGSVGPNEKVVVCLAEVPALRLGRVARIRALALPRIVKTRRPVVRRASRAEALRTLAPSSLVKRAVPIRASFSRMAHLVDRVPAYWLELGPDLADIPRNVDTLLREALVA